MIAPNRRPDGIADVLAPRTPEQVADEQNTSRTFWGEVVILGVGTAMALTWHYFSQVICGWWGL